MDNIIYGRNAVKEALKSGRNISDILISKTARDISAILSLAKGTAVVKFVDPNKLKAYGEKTQGVVAFVSPINFLELDDVLNLKKSAKPMFILICDHIQDPHNLGALFRTAYAVGVDAVIIPKRRTTIINATVEKVSAGAVNFLNIVRVSNLAFAIRLLKKEGVFIYCADAAGEDIYKHNFKGSVGLVVGSEGFGVSELVKKESDFLCSIPMLNPIDSLNVSVAGGIIMYEIFRQNISN